MDQARGGGSPKMAEALEPHDPQGRERHGLDYFVSYPLPQFLVDLSNDLTTTKAMELSFDSQSSTLVWCDLGRLLRGHQTIRSGTELCRTTCYTLTSLSRSIGIPSRAWRSPRDYKTARTQM